jgi:zinc transport system ATP-binding protein
VNNENNVNDANNMKQAVSLQNLSAGYGRISALENINLTIEAGSFTGIIGPNGGGKTTLLKVMLGLLKPWSGQVRIFGQNPQHNRRLIGYVPQAATINRKFPISVRQVVSLGRLAGKMPIFHRYSPIDRDRVNWCLNRTLIQWTVAKSSDCPGSSS